VSAPDVPPPPPEPQALLDWAQTQGVSARLDDVFIGTDGPVGAYLPGRHGERVTYRQILLEPDVMRRYRDDLFTAQRYLHRMAEITAALRQQRAWLDEHGREPESEVLLAFRDRLSAALRELGAARERPARPPGTYEPLRVEVVRGPLPMLRYEERQLRHHSFGVETDDDVVLMLLAWNEGALRWANYRRDRVVSGEVSLDRQQAAIEAILEMLRDPRAAAEQEILAEVLQLPAWRFALGTLDERLTQLETEAKAKGVEERIAFRVGVTGEGAIEIVPIRQKRGRSRSFSKGSRMEWYQLGQRPDLSPPDQRAYRAYDDRFARGLNTWGGPLSPAQAFGILRALIDHPAVFFEDQRQGRLDIRQGRLRLRFASGAHGALAAQFELLGVTLLAPEVDRALRDEQHLIYVHRPAGGTQILLAQLSPQAAAVVRALSTAPAQFPPESHDALATRLEPLQESMDIEFPSQWTRTIAPADARPVARLELLASGAVQIQLGVRPVKLGPVFPPGEGPGLVLEGQGRDRHGARRDLHAERQGGHALVERLGLGGGEETGPWCWRVSEGDPALHLVATLQDLGDEVVVEWADEGLRALGALGRGDMRLKVADKRDWFAIEGGAEVAGEVVPLAVLLAAIREGRRYVLVGKRGFARIEQALREALERAEGAVFEHRGVIEMAHVATDPLVGLVEAEAQIEGSASFAALRQRMKEGAGAAPRLPPPLDTALRPYQSSGVVWLARLAHWGAGAILADEMGLGKTIQTLALLVHRAERGPALVVAPTSVVPNWVAEAARFAPQLRVHLYRGGDREALLRGLGPGDLLATSYAIAALDGERLAGIRFASLVVDEAQAVKNAATERARALRSLDAEWRLGLTGTPIENHLGELWSLLRVISPGLLGSWEQFRGRYAVPIEKFGDDGRRRALAALLRPFLLRRTKAEVAPELPDRTELVRVVQLSEDEQALYEQLRSSTMEELEAAKKDPDRDAGQMRFTLLAALTRLRQLCCHPRLVYPGTQVSSTKAGYLLELLEELRETDHRTLVFSQFRSFLDLLAPRLRQHGLRVLVLDGTTPAEAREQRIAAFQRGEADVFLISLKAGGFGLNLTAADTVIHLDPWWNPAVEDQATARAHRIGQVKPVTALRLVARGTVEEAVLGLHASKRALAAGILEGSDLAASLGTDELMELIRRGPDGAAPTVT
jgi:superfamily II DNA or RNA helicase